MLGHEVGEGGLPSGRASSSSLLARGRASRYSRLSDSLEGSTPILVDTHSWAPWQQHKGRRGGGVRG